MGTLLEVIEVEYADEIPGESRFGSIAYRGAKWDVSHLSPFAFRADIGRAPVSHLIDVVVFFSCHCFTRSDSPLGTLASDYYRDGRETRVLCPARYELSKLFLPRLVKELAKRPIRVASSAPNFVTLEALDALGRPGFYAVYFEVARDSRRKHRLLLRVQSAYLLDQLSRRQREAGKVNLGVLLRATYEGRAIKG